MTIFLDIDGVMVPAKSWESPNMLEDGFYSFSHKAVQAINQIIQENTRIILTTSHKNRFTELQWKNIFNRRGIRIYNLEKLNHDQNFICSRLSEIMQWFKINNSNGNYIIIDDDTSLNNLPEYHKSHLILTNSMIGLNNSHLLRVNKIVELNFV